MSSIIFVTNRHKKMSIWIKESFVTTPALRAGISISVWNFWNFDNFPPLRRANILSEFFEHFHFYGLVKIYSKFIKFSNNFRQKKGSEIPPKKNGILVTPKIFRWKPKVKTLPKGRKLRSVHTIWWVPYTQGTKN